MRIQQKVASYEKIRKWKTGLIGQANGIKVVYLSVNSNSGLFKADLHLYVEYYVNEVIKTI